VEWLHLIAETGRAFREDCHQVPCAQRLGDGFLRAPGGGARAASEEYRLCLGRQPADQRPGKDLILRYEGCRRQGIDGEDVQP